MFTKINTWQKFVTRGNLKVGIEVKQMEGKHFCYYISIPVKSPATEAAWKVLRERGYYNEAFPFRELPFHHGITFGQAEIGQLWDQREYRTITVGCDYNHLWDEGIEYDLTQVQAHAEATAQVALDMIKKLNSTPEACGTQSSAQPSGTQG